MTVPTAILNGTVAVLDFKYQRGHSKFSAGTVPFTFDTFLPRCLLVISLPG